MIIFCDGVFDLFHIGHVNHFKKIKSMYPKCKLLVGVMNDKETTDYKRIPIYKEFKRCEFVNSCKYVDKVIVEYPSILDEDFIIKMKIDLVIHAFSNESDFFKQKKYFDIPIKLNKFKIIEYNTGISSTKLINKMSQNLNNTISEWETFWYSKKYLNLNLNLNDSIKEYFDIVTNQLLINHQDKILEIGSGNGIWCKFLNENYNYYGIDISETLSLRNIKLYASKIFIGDTSSLVFKDKYFDFSFSCFFYNYIKTNENCLQTLNEMIRVTKKGIFIIYLGNKDEYEKFYNNVIFKLSKIFKINTTFQKNITIIIINLNL